MKPFQSFPHWASWLIIGLFDSASFLVLSCCLLVATTSPAFGYVDPSVMTYTIQAVAGVAVALGAVLGVALRRTRRFLFRVFKIDENANKVVEPEVSAFSENPETLGAQQEEADNQARLVKETLTRGKAPKRLSWPKRFVRALIVSLFLVWGICVFTPLELVAAGSNSLLFSFNDVAGLVIILGVVLTLSLAFLLSLIRGKGFDLAMTIAVAIGIGCYIQALFLNVSLPVADGNTFSLMNYKTITVISTVVWVALFAALLLFNAKKTSYNRAFTLLISIALFAVQGITILNVTFEQSTNETADEEDLIMTTYGINEVGKESNVVVFVLDTFDTAIMETLLADQPDILDEFTGFTYFRNSSGSMIPTRYGVPFLITGVMPEPGESFNHYNWTFYSRGRLLPEIYNQGYELTIYSDSVNYNEIRPYTANIVPTDERQFNTSGLWLSLEKMALFREMPWLLKPFFWFNTDELNANAVDGYYIDDALYGQNLRNDGLTVSQASPKTFRFIHLLGAHYPFTLDSNGNRVNEGETDQLKQSAGSLGFVADYLRQLKAMGLYDQSTIIVTADHGEWYLTEDPLNRPTTPFLLAKPKETAAEAAEPIKISNVPTGHLDIPATIVQAVGGDTESFGTSMFDVTDAPRDRYYWETTSDGSYDISWIQYVIRGHVLDFRDWHLTGAVTELNIKT